MTSWAHRLVSIAGLGALLLSTWCGSGRQEDGAVCEESGDCASTKCVAGLCEGAYCTCTTTDCREQSNCQAGWLCARPSSTQEGGLSICRKQCTGPRTCQFGKHCENGLCRDGGEPFSLEWVSFPRKSPCSPRVPCKYEVKPAAGVNVATYFWSFGGAQVTGELRTTVPQTMITYSQGGTFTVKVEAVADDGATAQLVGTEPLCIAQDQACDPGGPALCCAGRCALGVCKVN